MADHARGRDIAEGAARSADDARQEYEAVALLQASLGHLYKWLPEVTPRSAGQVQSRRA
jgi:hypothetical protein